MRMWNLFYGAKKKEGVRGEEHRFSMDDWKIYIFCFFFLHLNSKSSVWHLINNIFFSQKKKKLNLKKHNNPFSTSFSTQNKQQWITNIILTSTKRKKFLSIFNTHRQISFNVSELQHIRKGNHRLFQIVSPLIWLFFYFLFIFSFFVINAFTKREK